VRPKHPAQQGERQRGDAERGNRDPPTKAALVDFGGAFLSLTTGPPRSAMNSTPLALKRDLISGSPEYETLPLPNVTPRRLGRAAAIPKL
jgi:hypothetical protein